MVRSKLAEPAMDTQPNVLLVEDDRAYSNEVSAALRNSGMVVTTTDNTKDALALLDAHEYGVVVLDLVLNDSDGFPLLERLRKTKRQESVIVVTRFARDYVRDLARYFGQVRMVINKPCSPQQLLASVTSALS